MSTDGLQTAPVVIKCGPDAGKARVLWKERAANDSWGEFNVRNVARRLPGTLAMRSVGLQSRRAGIECGPRMAERLVAGGSWAAKVFFDQGYVRKAAQEDEKHESGERNGPQKLQ